MKKLLLPIALIILSCSAEDSCEPTPKLTTADAGDITGVSATISGTITPPTCDYTLTSQGFVYGEENLPTVEDTKIVKSGSTISASLTNLNQNTTYYIRTFFENPTGVFYGNEVMFSTNVGDALVQTNTISNITATTALISGRVMWNGGGTIISKGFCFSTEANPTVNDQKVDGIDEGNQFKGTLENLTPSTLYHIKAYAENEAGVFYGEEKTFETFVEQPYADGTAIDQDGNTFGWINYGTQDWAIENAKVVTYRDGTPIPDDPYTGAAVKEYLWDKLNTGAFKYSYFGEFRFIHYNWYAFMGIHDNDPNTPNKEFAPEGWRVATESDWIILKEYLIANGYNYDQTTVDNKIAKSISIPVTMNGKSSSNDTENKIGWYNSTKDGAVGNNVHLNNSSGFNAIPEGLVSRGREHQFLGYNAYFWTPTDRGQGNVSCFSIDHNFLSLNYEYYHPKTLGMSVRFVRDTN